MVVLGLGSNLGDRETNLKRAVDLLARGPDAPLAGARLSRVYESEALVPEGAPDAWRRPYLNCAVAGETGLEPRTLLQRVKEAERRVGRRPGERWSPRVVDIDILWWSGVAVDGPHLHVPHRDLLERTFVLEPLRDLVPDRMHQGATFREHARRLRAAGEPSAVPVSDARRRVLRPRLMGILNVTPDSFSDGGLFLEPGAAVARAEELLDGGAEILDVGAESTRPGGEPVPPGDEQERLEPVLEGLADLRRGRSFRLSLDSRNPETVAWGLERGVDLVNDVTGFRDPAMLDVAADSDADLVFMHSTSVPVVPGEALPADRDPVELLLAWGRARLEAFARRGLHPSRLFFDPGLGFGKSAEQSWRLIEGVARFHALGVPLLVGHSRKSFYATVTDRPAGDRDAETVETSVGLARDGVEILRVHAPALHTRRFRAEDEAAGDPPAVAVGG